jgi:hypothetical protein
MLKEMRKHIKYLQLGSFTISIILILLRLFSQYEVNELMLYSGIVTFSSSVFLIVTKNKED